MKEFNIYKLHFYTPLHIGDEREDYGSSLKIYHSDSLYAALTSCLAKIGRDIPKDGDLGFSISSLFPFYSKENEDVLFMPKINISKLPDKSLQDVSKQIKKVEWLDIDYFNKQINGKNLFDGNFNRQALNGKYMTDRNIDSDFISAGISQRVQVSRDISVDDKDRTRPFYMERLFFKYESGLFFIADGNTELLETALEVLKDEGIGTDRTVGNGFFTYTKSCIQLDLPESEYVSNLSLYLPETEDELKEMMDADHISYDFIKRGGWITDSGYNSYRKNSVYMFCEGAIFNNHRVVKDVAYKGRIVDLRPDIESINWSVFRNGRSLFIPIKI